MHPFNPLLLEVWREVCRHLEIGESVARLAPLLAGSLPVDVLLVRHVDPVRGHIETLATGSCGPEAIALPARSDCPASGMDRMVTWCREGRVLHGPSSEALRKQLPGLLPPGLRGEVLAGPLNTEHGLLGVLLLATTEGAFGPEHQALARALLEPLTVALENDHRVRELNALREALEADKRSLLSRLGRDQMGETIVGAESGLRPVMEQVELVARSDVPVLILGETGSGKEVIARAIHNRSPRVGKPFLRVNCGAMPPELIDSELFGHEKGSFTGAVAVRQGWFERADGGTLFLDECGELPSAAQVRLLRILQDGTFERVGGERQLTVNVRVVAATHRDLQVLVREGKFREDLWYRLAVFPLYLPSLRERKNDIPALAAHFALRAARRLGTRPLVPTTEDVELLQSYPWPGNVRELSAVMERAAILGNGSSLEVGRALGLAARRDAAPDPEPRPGPRADGSGEFPPLDVAMARHIEQALRRTHGRIEGPYGAARLLGINPHTLRARMRKLGLEWRHFRPAPRP
jgi:transcriptional regulator with GAF, ATPase, and Fis domain